MICEKKYLTFFLQNVSYLKILLCTYFEACFWEFGWAVEGGGEGGGGGGGGGGLRNVHN